jgi:glucokinase
VSSDQIIGVDIGGTHITSGWVSLGSGTLQEASLVRKTVNAHGTAEEIIREWSACIQSVEGFSNRSRIGIAMPGPFDYEKGIALMKNQGKYDALYQLNVRNPLAKALGIEPEQIRFENDAACFLIGEVSCGIATGLQHVIGITLGTGLGSTRYHEGKAEDADLWNTPYKESIYENYLVTRWFVNTYKEKSGNILKGVKELAENYQSDQFAPQLFDGFAHSLADFLQFFIERDKPEMVVMGGNISKAHHFFLPQLTKLLAEQEINIPLKISILGEHAALLGAGFLWKH